MKNIELKHLTPYLPYNLHVMWEGVFCEVEGVDLHFKDTIIVERVNVNLSEVKPILRPLSDLKNFYHEICWELYDSRNPNNYDAVKYDVDYVIENGLSFDTDYKFVEWMIENHFDIYGLIKKELAIDINTL